MQKRHEYADADSDLNRARWDEPLLIIGASDPHFAELVERWCALAREKKTHKAAEIEERAGLIDLADAWQALEKKRLELQQAKAKEARKRQRAASGRPEQPKPAAAAAKEG